MIIKDSFARNAIYPKGCVALMVQLYTLYQLISSPLPLDTVTPLSLLIKKILY